MNITDITSKICLLFAPCMVVKLVYIVFCHSLFYALYDNILNRVRADQGGENVGIGSLDVYCPWTRQ